MMRADSSLLLSVFVSVGLVACGGDDAVMGNGDEMAMAGSSSTGEGEGPAALNGCKPDSFVDLSAEADERVVQIAVDGLVYTPPCTMIAVGQSVKFEGSLSAHPLAPGNANDAAAGSPANPITPTSSGSSAEFSFETSGTFPFYCELHGFGDGKGMAGAIYVRPAE